MIHSNFFKPVESLVLTPKAARLLLYALAWLVVLCLGCAIALYLGACVNSRIAQERRLMNDGFNQARGYFERREALLKHFGALAIRDVSLPKQRLDPHRKLPRYQRQPIVLGEPGGEWAIQLSGQDLDTLDRLGGGLLYISDGPTPTVSYLHGRFERRSMVSEAILKGLAMHVAKKNMERIWLVAAHDPLQRIYMFLALHCEGRTVWLGIEWHGSNIQTVLADTSRGGGILLSEGRRIILGDGPRPDGVRSCLEIRDAFGFCGSGIVPEFLALNKEIGPSGWRLNYYITVQQLLFPLWSVFLCCLLLYVSAAACVIMLARRIDSRLLHPAHKQLRDLIYNEEFLCAALDVVPIAICLLRCTDAKVVLENRLARQWLGDGSTRRAESMRWVEQAKVLPAQLRTLEMESSGQTLQVSLVPTLYKGEQVLLCACSNISVRKQSERELHEVRQLLISAHESKRLFIAAMGREIRTPLYGVFDSLKQIGLTNVDRQQRWHVESIRRSALGLQQLARDALDISRLEAGHVVLEQHSFDPFSLLRDAVKAHYLAAYEKGVDLYICCDPYIPELLRGDAALIRQVLDHLLDNAVKFTADGFIVLRVRVLYRQGNRLRVLWQVTDTGCGIPAKQQSELFQPFFQIKRGSVFPHGFGLGLAITHRLIQLLGGDIRVVSETGLGSGVSVELWLTCETAAPLQGQQPSHVASIPVYIRCRPGDLRESVSGWLKCRGVSVLAWQTEGAAGSVLLECLLAGERALADEHWVGPRVIALADGPEKPTFEGGAWRVCLHDLKAIQEAVWRAHAEWA